VRFEFDSEADALYIRIKEGRVERTIELDEGVYADLDAESRPRRIRRVDEAPRNPQRAEARREPGIFSEFRVNFEVRRGNPNTGDRFRETIVAAALCRAL
jgi:hypothetical protein